ncbi:MAG: class I SAM-dependent methyltransferase [Patescibacteria group bacterium]|jgi:SAM-dependent methyltransferase
MESHKGMWTLDDRLNQGGYGADPEVPRDYRDRIEGDPDWQKDIEAFLKLVPEEIELQSGKISLSEATVLDIGSGPGVMAERIKDRVKKVIALDREMNMTSDVKERLSSDGKVAVVRGDFLEIPLADESVDLALSAGTVWHIPVEKMDQKGKEMTPTQIEDQFLSEALRALKPGGVYILNGVWNGKNESVAKEFAQKRQEEISGLVGKDSPLIYRKFVISSDGLEERLKSLGYVCEVEMPNCTKDTKNGDARITLLEKLHQRK